MVIHTPSSSASPVSCQPPTPSKSREALLAPIIELRLPPFLPDCVFNASGELSDPVWTMFFLTPRFCEPAHDPSLNGDDILRGVLAVDNRVEAEAVVQLSINAKMNSK